MVSKAIGIVLVIVALVITILLIARGGTLVPHIVGPIALAVIGTFLLMRNKKAASPAE